jgi:outer membrane protein assembly factor BamE
MPFSMRNYLLIAAIGLATSGCGIIYKQPIYQGNLIDKTEVDQLVVGQSKQQVLALLGTPSVADPFHAQRWDYTATERTDRLGRVQMKNFTVYFDNDQVTKWEGDYFPNQDEQLARNSVRQFGPNLAKDKKKGQGGG